MRKRLFKLKIVFENSLFVLINKPAGLNFHSEDGPGLVVLATAQLGVDKLYPVHRLDKMTSGLVILTKTVEAAQRFTALFEKRRIEKFYLAISLRKPKKKQGWVKGDMATARRGNYKLLNTSNNPTVTQFISTALRVHERLFLVKPHTGKTHQIRVALKSVAAPIAGDIRYANADDARLEDRGYLHAYALRFTLDDEIYSFVTPPDEGERFLTPECTEQLRLWSKPWELFKTTF